MISGQKLSSQPFVGLAFETDYMVRIVPFPTFMNDSLFPPSFLHTNSKSPLPFLIQVDSSFSTHDFIIIAVNLSPLNFCSYRVFEGRVSCIMCVFLSQVAKGFLAPITSSANHVSLSGETALASIPASSLSICCGRFSKA